MISLRSYALLALFALAGCGVKAEKPRDLPPITVESVALEAQSEARTVIGVGSLRAAQNATLTARVMGSVLEIRRTAGEAVRRGEVLLVIDPREVRGQIAQAEGALAQAKAALVLAQANHERFAGLHARGSASTLELDQALYQRDTAAGAVRQAEGALETARSYLTYAEVAAPFDGRVVDRMCEVGDLAAPGRPLMTIEDARRMRLFVTLAENELETARVGSKVDVTVPALGESRSEATVTEIVPGIDPATHSFTVKLDLAPNEALQSGLFARAVFPAESRSVLRLPHDALVERGGLRGAFVAEGDHATFRLLLLSDRPAENPEILSGIEAGARVVVRPPANLEDGSRIEARP